jgi:transposase
MSCAYMFLEFQAVPISYHVDIIECRLRIDPNMCSQTRNPGLGKAITYAKNNWKSLILFLDDPKLGLYNNVSERNLRLIALGRKNFLFVGNDEAGESLAINQSLVSSCILNGIDPEQYLTDVLIRIQTHPQSRIDELLPHLWKAPG